jgi:CelD/BcsL family acetyltransferase involved in cellulose biosynthesis
MSFAAPGEDPITVPSRPESRVVGLEVVTSLPALQELRHEWERLEQEVETATIYQTWAWVVSWYEHFGAGKQLQVLVARAGDGQLVGVLPLSITTLTPVGPRLLYLLGRGKYLTEYVDALLRPDLASAIVDAIVDHWDRERRRWDLWIVQGTPVESPFVRGLCERGERAGYTVVTERKSVRIRRSLPSNWEAFHATLGRNMRKHLRKFSNRLERDGWKPEVTIARDVDGVDVALNVLFELHGRRAAVVGPAAHSDRFHSATHRAFLRAVTGRLAERRRVWLGVLKVGGEPVAAQLCFGFKQRFHVSHSGVDPAWAWYAVMMHLFRHCLELAMSEGYQELDLGLGYDQEKLRWGGEAKSVVILRVASRRLLSRVALALWGRRRRSPTEPTIRGPGSAPVFHEE